MHRWPEDSIDVARARHPSEATATTLMIVTAIPMYIAAVIYVVVSLGLVAVAAGLVVLGMHLFEFIALAYIRTNAVRVGPDQFAEIDAMADNFARRLGIVRPEVFVMQDSVWNAFATKLAGQRVVVLLSGAIDSLMHDAGSEQLAFVVGHELGHHAAGHLDWKHKLIRWGAWMPWIGMWHRRCMELTCDRLALACCGDGELALRGLVSLSVGTRLTADTNVEAVVRQWESVKHHLSVQLLTLYSLYPHKLARVAGLRETAQQWGMLPAPERLAPVRSLVG